MGELLFYLVHRILSSLNGHSVITSSRESIPKWTGQLDLRNIATADHVAHLEHTVPIDLEKEMICGLV